MTTIHAHRFKAMGIALLGAAFVAIGLWMYVDAGPAPAVTSNPWVYQEPFKTLASVATVLLFGAVSLAGLYWAVTPAPLLELSATGVLCHRFPLFPFVKQTLHWNDIANISAVKTGSRVEVWVTVTPHAVVSSGSKPARRVSIRQGLLPLSGDKLVHLLRRYHDVTYCRIQSGRVTEIQLLSRDDDVTHWTTQSDQITERRG